MSKTVDDLRELGIYNVSGMLERFAEKGKDVACCFTPWAAREMRGNVTHVYSPSHKTNPEAHWMDRGRKAFYGNRKRSMPEAVAWATKQYGVSDWAPCPTDPQSVRIPKVVRERAMAAIKAAWSRRGDLT